jgi:IS1 family transposase
MKVKLKIMESYMSYNLSIEKKMLVLSSLVEGNSIRSIERMTGVNRNTIMTLMLSVGKQCEEILDRELVNIKSNFIQADEIWCYVGKKQKQCTEQEKKAGELGDQYVFVAMDADSKLVPLYRVGKRNSEMTLSFIKDLQARINTRFQLSTDSFNAYADAVDRVFGEDIDYGQVHKQYGEEAKSEKRYSPANIISVSIRPMLGNPKRNKISTSYVERQNLTMRMQMRRFTRLTNAFSKKLVNLKAALAIHFFHYNFMRVHQTLRVTPAMEAGISNHIWGWEELFGIVRQERKVA